MAKILAILAASAAVAGGATYAVFHHLNPYNCPLSGCEVAKVKCCATPTEEACPASAATPDSSVAAAGPVGMFVSTTVPADGACCAALTAKPAARTACCASGAACCASLEACCPALTAAVGPAAAVR